MKPLEYSHVYVIESLRPNDEKTGTSLFNDTIRRRLIQQDKEKDCHFFSVESRIQLFEALEDIRVRTIHGANPILHIEAHGDENGIQVTNGDIVNWSELAFWMMQINGICSNNLFVTMATCKGGYIFKAINPRTNTPFWGFIGPFEEVNGDEVLANYSAFYDSFLSDSDFNNAEVALHASNPQMFSRFRLYSTELIFAKAYRNYKEKHLTPERINERILELIDQSNNYPELRGLREDARAVMFRHFLENEQEASKKTIMRKFFMLDVFPEHRQYYDI